MSSIRQRRLTTDYERLRLLEAANRSRVEVVGTLGRPPYQYDITLRCRSVVSAPGARPSYGRAHTVRIAIPPGYPLEDTPRAAVLTPIWHPHVFRSSNNVCIGTRRDVSEFLDAFVCRLYDILRYDPLYLDPHSPANAEAMEWAQSNMGMFPLDGEPLVRPGTGRSASQGEISWTDRA